MPQRNFLPEGAAVTRPDRSMLESALKTGQILQATVKSCTENHNMILDLDGQIGMVPKAEAAIGADTGNIRDIAIISRVGKAISFTVQGLGQDGAWLLSRRRAQQQALDWHMENTRPGHVIGGCVTHMESFGAFVDIGCGVVSFVGIENISVSRIPHPCHRFAPRQMIIAAVLEVDHDARRITLTHRELLGTWRQNVEALRPGSTVQGIVRGVEDYGLFVELSPNLSGLAEVRAGFAQGDRVSVFVKNIIPDRMKIKLILIDRLEPAPPRLIAPSDYFITAGTIDHWVYSPQECRGKVIRRVF